MSLYLSKKVMRNDSLRRAFNTLAVKTFGLSFEDWYQKGYWSEFNTPYTIFDGDRAVANVSVNQLKILCQGKVYNGIQLGTVMTDEAYRNQGLSRHIMEQVKEDWEKRYDFIFLFANESVLDFYPKFGFERKEQYQFETKAVPSPGLCRKLNMDSLHDRQMLAHYYKKTNPFSEIQVIDNYGLLMFYCCSFMKDWVYYSPEYDAVVIANRIITVSGAMMSTAIKEMKEMICQGFYLPWRKREQKGLNWNLRRMMWAVLTDLYAVATPILCLCCPKAGKRFWMAGNAYFHQSHIHNNIKNKKQRI